MPQPSAATPEAIEAYAAALAPDAERYGVTLGDPVYTDDDWAAKVEVLLDLRPEVASFTFGLPSGEECRRLREAGIATVGTVTSVGEAEAAIDCGVDAIAVQGPAAGGHRGTFDPVAEPNPQPLNDLLAAVVGRFGGPVIAAGGLMSAEDVAAVIDAGAVAAQLGTAFLLADEAGSSPVHRKALQDSQFTETAVTRSFSGRYARGLHNRFIDDHEAQAPFGYPEIHYLTGPLRAGSVRAGDPHATNVWAGTGFKSIRTGSVAEIMGSLSASAVHDRARICGPRPRSSTTMSPFSVRAVITAAAASPFVVPRNPHDRRTSLVPGVGVDQVGPARRQPDRECRRCSEVASTVRGAASLKSTSTSPLSVVALNESVTAIADRVITSPLSVCASIRRADPLSSIAPFSVFARQLVEVGLGHQHPVLLPAGDSQPARKLGRQHDLDLAGPAPLQER